MPIPLQDFSDELDSFERSILNTLETKPYQAYTLTELMGDAPQSEGLLYNVLVAFSAVATIEKLIDRQLVTKKRIGGQDYYASSRLSN